MKKILFITTFVVFIFVPISISADIIINEIMYDLEEGSDSGREWMEIFNNSDMPVDLTDWKFYENETNHRLTIIQGNTILPKNEHAIITDNPDKFLIDNPSYSGALFDSTFSLSNNGENLALKDAGLVIIDELTYDSSWGASGDGNSLQRKIASGNSNEPTNWGTGNPTPGALNTFLIEEEPEEEEEVEEEPVPFEETPTEAPPTTTGNQLPIADAGDNIIGFVNQEIEFDGTNSSDPDEDELFCSWNMGDGKVIDKPKFTYKYSYPGTYLVTLTVSDGQDYALDTITIKIKPQQITINEFIPNPEGKDEENEWIEIYNDSDSIVDISGWQLDDEEEGSNPFIFPENSLMAPKNYLVFSRQITGIALNNDKDSVRLLLPEGMVFQEVNYENPKQGQSSARTDEGFVWNIPTPGIANITGPPQSIGSLEKQFTYQQPIESETTKEPSQDYSWYFQDPEQEIKGGFTIQEPITNDKDDKDKFAAVSSFAKATEDKSDNQATLNLVLMIIAVILAGLIIGLFLTKLSKKFP